MEVVVVVVKSFKTPKRQNVKTPPKSVATQAALLRELVQPDRRVVNEFQNSVWVLVQYRSIEGAFGSVEPGRAPISTVIISFARDLLRALFHHSRKQLPPASGQFVTAEKRVTGPVGLVAQSTDRRPRPAPARS